MLSINIHPITNARGIEKPFNFLVKAGFGRHTASSIVAGSLVSIRIDHIEKLCRLLYCLPHDIMVWHPDKSDTIPSGHPLYALKPTGTMPDWKKTLETLPYDQLKEIVRTIAEKNKQ